MAKRSTNTDEWQDLAPLPRVNINSEIVRVSIVNRGRTRGDAWRMRLLIGGEIARQAGFKRGDKVRARSHRDDATLLRIEPESSGPFYFSKVIKGQNLLVLLPVSPGVAQVKRLNHGCAYEVDDGALLVTLPAALFEQPEKPRPAALGTASVVLRRHAQEPVVDNAGDKTSAAIAALRVSGHTVEQRQGHWFLDGKITSEAKLVMEAVKRGLIKRGAA